MARPPSHVLRRVPGKSEASRLRSFRLAMLVQAVGLVLVLACNHANLLAPSVLATAGNNRAAWGTLPRTDLFPIIFSSAMSE